MFWVLNRYVDKQVEQFLREREEGYFSLKDKIFLYRELAYLVEWWVAIADSVIVIRNGTDKWSMRKIATDMYNALNEWETLSYSMAQLPRYFNAGDVNIIRSWEESWEMTHVLKYLAQEYEFLAKIKSKYIWAMIYPALLFSVSILAVFMLFTKILPWIFDMVATMPWAKIPALTQFLINMTGYMTENTAKIIFTTVFGWFALWVIFSTQAGKQFLDQNIFHAPLIGKVTQYYDLVKFMRYMKLLMDSWMNFLEVFEFLKTIMPNYSYKVMIDDIIWAINRWETIWATLEKYTDFIPKDVVALLKVWEETASFEWALSNAIVMYQDEFEKMIDGLSKVIEPILVVFIGWIIAMVAMSVFGVIWSLLDWVQW